MTDKIQWLDPASAPRDGSYFAAKFKDDDVPMVLQWDDYAHQQGGWWLDEGAVIKYDLVLGWSPLPAT